MKEVAPSLLSSFGVQIRSNSDPRTGRGRPATREGSAPLELFEGNRELLDDFLARLQSIIRRAPNSAPPSPDDTRPASSGRRVRS